MAMAKDARNRATMKGCLKIHPTTNLIPTMKLLSPIFLISGGAFFASNAAAVTVTLGDAAADYVAAAGGPNTTLTVPPPGWSYFGSTLANGGTEAALTAGQVGNQGVEYQGFVGVSNNGVAAVYGTNTASSPEFEIFANGEGNNAIVGTDLLLHPGGDGAADEFAIVRYTVGDASTFIDGTGTIGGSFREGIIGGGGSAQSIFTAVYLNDDQLFTVTGGTAAQGTASQLEQATGTFDLSGLTFAAGDTIDFVVGPNAQNGADETALQSLIQVDTVPEPSSALLGAIGALGLLVRRRR